MGKTVVLRIVPMAIVVSGVTVAQFHGVQFWIGLLSSTTLGWTISLTWESASLWLWWRDDKAWNYRIVKFAATAAVMGGMIAQGAGPLLLAGETELTQGKIRAAATVAMNRMLVAIVDQERRGFKDTLDNFAAKALTVPKKAPEQRVMQLPFPAEWMPWLAWVPVIAFPALYALALLALVTLANEIGAGWNGRRSLAPQIATVREPPERPERTALRVFAKRNHLTTQREVADKITELPSAVSEFANGRAAPNIAARIQGKLNAT